MLLKPGFTEIGLTLLSLGVLFFYHFQLYRQVRSNPLTTAVGLTNPASLLINVPQDLEPSSSVDAVALILNHGALHYTLGMRGFYLAIPLGLWLFGPFWMLGGSVLAVFVLYRLDREV